MITLISQNQKSAFICVPICVICGKRIKDSPLISADVTADLAERNISVHLRTNLRYLRENLRYLRENPSHLHSPDLIAILAALSSRCRCGQRCNPYRKAYNNLILKSKIQK